MSWQRDRDQRRADVRAYWRSKEAVPCPRCRAVVGQSCVTLHGPFRGQPRTIPCIQRIDLFGQMEEAKAKR